MLVKLSPHTEELLRSRMDQHPDNSTRQILEEAAYFSRELDPPI